MSQPPTTFRVVSRRRPVSGGAVLAVALGGALGAPARYALGHSSTAAGAFPWTTFVVNLTGALALGVLVVLVAERLPPTRYVRAFFGTGLLGTYTTYSTFAVAVDLLTRDGAVGTVAAYVTATVAGGLVAAWAGTVLARAVPGLGRSA
jgi:fluoride exporter